MTFKQWLQYINEAIAQGASLEALQREAGDDGTKLNALAGAWANRDVVRELWLEKQAEKSRE